MRSRGEGAAEGRGDGRRGETLFDEMIGEGNELGDVDDNLTQEALGETEGEVRVPHGDVQLSLKALGD